jgi:hypothetical protein
MLYVVYFGGKSTGDNWTLIETREPIDFYETLEAFKRAHRGTLVNDFIGYLNEVYGEGMASRPEQQVVLL